MRYRLGWPLGRMAARMGVPTLIRINVIKDEEAGVFVGTSEDLAGLVIEAESLEALMVEARGVIPCLLDASNRDHLREEEIIPRLQYENHPIHAHA